jgi:hypothetical protein
MRVVEAQCVGENSCTVRASNEIFEEPCYGTCVRACVRVRMRACVPYPYRAHSLALNGLEGFLVFVVQTYDPYASFSPGVACASVLLTLSLTLVVLNQGLQNTSRSMWSASRHHRRRLQPARSFGRAST